MICALANRTRAQRTAQGCVGEPQTWWLLGSNLRLSVWLPVMHIDYDYASYSCLPAVNTIGSEVEGNKYDI